MEPGSGADRTPRSTGGRPQGSGTTGATDEQIRARKAAGTERYYTKEYRDGHKGHGGGRGWA